MQSLRLAVCAAVLALPACALNRGSSAPSSSPDRITAEEIAAEDARNAYELVQRLRPEWLRQRVDHRRATGTQLQTLILYNNSRYGLLPSLRDLPPEMLGSLEFLNASAAQEVLTAADRDIGAVIRVYSRGVAMDRERDRGRARGPTRVGVSLYPLAFATQERAGTGGGESGEDRWLAVDDGGGSPMGMMGAVEVGLGPRLLLEAVVSGGLGSRSDAYERYTVQMHLTQTGGVAAGVLSYDLGYVRLGAGPAFQASSLRWAGGECACIGGNEDQHFALGAVVQGTARAPVAGRLTAELRVQRYLFQNQGFQPAAGGVEFPVRRPGWFVGLGGGVQLVR